MPPQILTLRLARPCDAIGLQTYFRNLSKCARYDRFLGAINEVPIDAVMRNIGWTDCNAFSVIAIGGTEDAPRIIGEAVCAVAEQAEVALSVEDASQRTGIGRALLAAVETRAARRGAHGLYGYIWSSNDAIRKLASTLGYSVERASGDWKSYVLRKSLAVEAQAGVVAQREVAASVSSQRTVAASGVS